MTRRKPLQWYTLAGDAAVPACVECYELFSSPVFVEAVYSVAIERSDAEPVDLARRTVEDHHARGHPEEL